MDNEKDIDILINRYLSGEATAGELKELERWLAEDRRNVDRFLRYQNIQDVCRPAFAPEDINLAAAYREIIARIQPRYKRHKQLVAWGRVVAAAVFVFAIVTAGILLFRAKQTPPVKQQVAQAQPSALPAVKLTLSSGEEIIFTGTQTREIAADSNTVARGDSKGLTYTHRGETEDTLIYHTLSVPRGGEFFLELSDNTRVWINAETTVRYPATFRPGKREIYIDGEAYLEVARDTASPFSVIMPGNRVTVLGTSFNVTSYPELQGERVTLVSGKVQVHSVKSGKNVTLSPGEQAVIQREKGTIVTRTVDTDLYCSWHTGVLIFRNNTLEEILSVLARQYNVEIYWHDNSLKEYTFSGELKRYESVDTLLEMIGKTDYVKFTVHDKKIIVAKP